MPEPLLRSTDNDATVIPVLRAGGIALDNGPRRMGRLRPRFAAGRPSALREAFEAEGYLWLKGFLNRAEVLGSEESPCRRPDDRRALTTLSTQNRG